METMMMNHSYQRTPVAEVTIFLVDVGDDDIVTVVYYTRQLVAKVKEELVHSDHFVVVSGDVDVVEEVVLVAVHHIFHLVADLEDHSCKLTLVVEVTIFLVDEDDDVYVVVMQHYMF